MNQEQFLLRFNTLLLLVMVGWLACGQSAHGEPGDASRLPCGSMEARVLRVVDGDTIDVRVAGVRLRVRLLGLDAPEIRDRRPTVRLVAKAARRRLRELARAGQYKVQMLPAIASQCMFTEHHVRWKPRVLARVMVFTDDDWMDAATILIREGLACPRRVKNGCDPRPR